MQRRTNYRKWIKYLSFIILDLTCLHIAFILACGLYLGWGRTGYADEDYAVVALVMSLVDILITLIFHTLNLILRRSLHRELLETTKHVLHQFNVAYYGKELIFCVKREEIQPNRNGFIIRATSFLLTGFSRQVNCRTSFFADVQSGNLLSRQYKISVISIL